MPINILEVEGDSPYSDAMVGETDGPPFKGSYRKLHGCGVHKSLGRHQKSGSSGVSESYPFLGRTKCFAIYNPGMESLAGGFSQPSTVFKDVHLLASRFNVKLERVVSRTRDPQAFRVDALVTLWDQFSPIYVFPLLQL